MLKLESKHFTERLNMLKGQYPKCFVKSHITGLALQVVLSFNTYNHLIKKKSWFLILPNLLSRNKFPSFGHI